MLNNPETLREAQEILISALEHIDEICKENKIEYWIDSGTLLGAYRNSTFIPWDEDIDLCMTRENYERFLLVASDKLNTHKYYLQNINSDKYYIAFPVPSKIRVNDTEILWTNQLGEKYNYSPKSHSGLYIDIFPMDNYLDEYRLHRKFIIFLYKLLYLNRYTKLTFFKRSILKISNYFLSKKTVDRINKNFFTRINKKESEFLDYSCDMALSPYKFSRKTIFPLKEIYFEGNFYPCPNNVNDYLTKLYGNNYMMPPSSPYQHGKITKLFNHEFK
ncbi:LicD family protein [Providencia rettgeri]